MRPGWSNIFFHCGKEKQASLEIWDSRPHVCAFQKAVAVLSFHSGVLNNAQRPGNSAADTPESFPS